MPLTPEQITLYRRQYGLDSKRESGSSSSSPSTPKGDPSARIQALRAKKVEAATVEAKEAEANKKSSPMSGSLLEKGLKTIFDVGVKKPLESLVIKPGVRTGQALGQLGLEAAAALTDNEKIDQARDRGREITKEDVEVPILGGMTVEGQKKFGEGGGKQIAGEALESATNIASIAIAPGAGKAITAPASVVKGAAVGAAKGAGIGAAYGGASGVAHGLQEDKTTGEIVEEGVKGAAVGAATGLLLGGVTGGISGRMNGRQARRVEAQRLIDEGDISNKKLATFDTKTLQKDPKALEAIRQGVDEGDVAVIKTMSKSDKDNALKMIDFVEKAKANKKNLARPLDAVGQTVLKPAKAISETIKKTAKELDTVADSLKTKALSQADDVIGSMDDDLAGIGASVGDDGVNLQGSTLEGVGSNESIINNVYRRIKGAKDAHDFHIVKKYIDNNVDYGKSAGGLTGEAERLLKGWRRTIDSALDVQFPEYNRVNTILAENIDQMDDLYSILGKNFRISDPLAEIKTGQVAAKILSNSQNRGDVMATLKSLQDVAKKYGYQSDDDIINQVLFADMLEDMFGTQATRSLQGQTKRAVEDVLDVGGNVGRGEFVKAAAKGVVKGFKAIKGINEQTQMKALRALLSSADDVVDDVVKAAPNMQSGMINFTAPLKEPTKVSTGFTLETMDRAREAIKNSGALDLDRAIAAGDLASSEAYKSGKILTDNMAKGRIDDVAMKLDLFKKGLGEVYRKEIGTDVTMEQIVKKGLEILERLGKKS